MSLRLYDYECLQCKKMIALYREQTEVYEEVVCPHCSEKSDGKKAKRITTSATVRYKQGNLKGKMNSYGR